MATWNDVKGYLNQVPNFAPEEVGDGAGLKFVFELADGRSQLVFVGPVTEDWLVVSSPISPLDKVDANKVLASGIMGSAPGGLTVDGDIAAYACNLYIDSIQGPELVEVIETVTIAADTIEKFLGLGDDW